MKPYVTGIASFALLALMVQAPSATAQSDDRDVETSPGPVDTLRFDTDEGTWMNLDVSPDGRWVVFDLLGDIYRIPIEGGEAVLLSGGASWEHQPRYSPDGAMIAFTSDRSGRDNIWLMNADGSQRHQFTELEETLPTNPVWLPGGDYIVVKRHVRSTRSLGGGELWMYHINGGSGVKLFDKASFTTELNEPYPSTDGTWIYYSVSRPFDYNQDPHAGIFQVRRYNRLTGRNEPVTGDPGGAIRPIPSPDGRSLAFVRRIGLNTVLMLRDLETGSERVVFRGLDHDQQETWAVHGAYPGYQWTPDGARIVVSFEGKIWAITVASGEAAAIPFVAHVEQTVARALHFPREIDADSVRARMIRWPSLSPDGETLLFQAFGRIWRMNYSGGTPVRVTGSDVLEFAPSYSPDGRWITYTTWDDDDGGQVWKVDATRRRAPVQLTTVPDQYANPRFSPDGNWIAFVQGSGGVNRGRGLSDEQFLNIRYVGAAGGEVHHVIETSNRGSNSRMPRITWSADGTRLLYQENSAGNTVLSSVKLDGTDRQRLVSNEHADEIVVSPDGKWVAFKELHNVYVAPLPAAGNEPVTLEATTKSVRVARLSEYSGDWLEWRPDSRALSWVLGPAFYLQTLDSAGLGPEAVLRAAAATDEDAADEDEDEDEDDGDGEAAGEDGEDVVGWIEGNARVHADITEIHLTAVRARPEGTVVLRGARIITMAGETVLEEGDVVVTGNRITSVGPVDAGNDAGANVVDVSGRTIMPGIIDVHAHMGYLALDINPERSWQYYANLAYGVTTTHDPSASTQFVFSQAELVETGQVVGPRVFSTGFILYGAENDARAVITSRDDARAHLRRLAAVGAFSVKSYNQMRRDVRQWIVDAAREEEMLVVPEGGSMWQQNMTQVIDGHTGIEHAIPLAPLYNDVLTLIGSSGTGYTPTLVVGYGGVWGENYWYQESDVYRNERLLQFVPRGVLDARARRRMLVPEDEFYHFELARAAKAVIDAGGAVQLGAHGQLQGLGAHWELWMFAQGGMTPLETLRAATLAGAEYLGLDRDLGSIEAGKLADIVILDGNPLEDIRATESIFMVMKNGVLFDADMNEVWPQQAPVPPLRQLGR